MDAELFASMLSDSHFLDLKKLHYKYHDADMQEFIGLLQKGFYHSVPLKSFTGKDLVYLPGVVQVKLASAKLLFTKQRSGQLYGLKAMEDEIVNTFTIESIDTSRESVRKILSGYAPATDSENRIYGMKKGLDYISDVSHRITEDSIYELYQMAIGQYLPEEDRLPFGRHYRNDAVYVVGAKLEHTGLAWERLDEYMPLLVEFIQNEQDVDDLLKAAVIHFYIAYLHPYFDGNGRLARLLQLWYLVQKGYSYAMFVPFSAYIQKSRKQYYDAYTLVEENEKISGQIDVTPFLAYFVENVYHKLSTTLPELQTNAQQSIFADGIATEKETALWQFVLSSYGTEEFSTKQLEKDFGNAAYATIRSFVMKFAEHDLLEKVQYGSRVKYKIKYSK